MMLANAAAKYKSELRLVARALTAAVLSFLIAETLHLPQSYWAVLTALIIVQDSLGGTLVAGIDRVVGTVAGAAVGFAAALARRLGDVPESHRGSPASARRRRNALRFSALRMLTMLAA